MTALALGLVLMSPQTTPAFEAYVKKRYQMTEPTYGLAKVKGLIKANQKKDSEYLPAELPKSQWDALSDPEKFTYCMIHAEYWSQNCAAEFNQPGDENRILRKLARPFRGDRYLSPRQENFLKSHRSQVLDWLHETLSVRKQTGVNLRSVVVMLNGTDLIPDLVICYRRDRSDQDQLSVLIHLMAANTYKPWLNSSLAKEMNKLGYIASTRPNQEVIMRQAFDFYATR